MRSVHRFLTAAALLTVGSSPASGQDTVTTIGQRVVAVWSPPQGSGRQPVVIFSHGFWGCSTGSTFLTEAIAARGYWVFAPNHDDARCGGTASGRSQEPFMAPERWTDSTYRNRAEDIRAVLAGIAHDPRYRDRVALGRVALAGHSLGGYTVVGLAGGWSAWKIPGVKAVLALSPYVQPFVVHGTLGNLAAPVMYQGGSLDFGITPWLKREDGAFDASPRPKYFVELRGGWHLSWTDMSSRMHERILHYSLAFLDRHVKGMPQEDLGREIPGTTLRFLR